MAEYTQREEAQFNVMRRRTLTLAGNALVAVGAGAPNVVFTFPRAEPDTNYIAVATPQWASYVYCSAKTLADCTFTFSAAPGAPSTLNVVIMRGE